MNGCTVIKTRRLTRSNCDVKEIVKSSRRNCWILAAILSMVFHSDKDIYNNEHAFSFGLSDVLRYYFRNLQSVGSTA